MENIKLTEKEIRFIELKRTGMSYDDISRKLFLSLPYVYKLASELYIKTGTTNGSSLIAWAFENNILKIKRENLPTKDDKAA